MLEKDWDAPADICIITELLAVRANQNLASIGLKLYRRIKIRRETRNLYLLCRQRSCLAVVIETPFYRVSKPLLACSTER